MSEAAMEHGINWSEAPKGFDYWIDALGDYGTEPGFHRYDKHENKYYDEDENFWHAKDVGTFHVIGRPKPAEPAEPEPVQPFLVRHRRYLMTELCTVLVHVANERQEVEQAALEFHEIEQEQIIRQRYGTWA